MQPYPRSPDLVWPGHLHGTGCLSARAVGTGIPTVVRRLCLGLGCGWVWVLLTPPVLAGVLGGCVWARFVVLSLLCRLFVVFVVGPRFWACLWDVCGFVRVPLAPRRFRFRCAVWACVLGPGLGCAPPFLAGLSGCVFCGFFLFCFCGVGCWVSLSRALWSLAPHPFVSGWAAGSFFFRGVCLHVSVSLFPVGRCSWLGVAGFGWVVLNRYPEPMAHGPEACEPSHPLWPTARRPVSRHTRAEAVDTGCQRDIPVL